ncbi:tmp1 [Ecytonucleospora hepatopenaei]|uniref:dTMP kinase n=1 Tax=Ecytonucleospora hepatopenaei TaxID=646526 RepID=A0A1W0E282_9MICR|nr:tmp1 [Ecytonucleospora hepatopenaei]
MKTNKNLFIVLEGIDHSGKTSVAKKLHEILGGVKIAFPNRETKTGKEIDKYLKGNIYDANNNNSLLNNTNNSLLNTNNNNNSLYNENILNNNLYNNLLNNDNKHIHILFSNNRYEQVDYITNTLLHNNIICDRYWISGAVYSAAKGLDYEWCKELDSKLPMPDITFFLDVPFETTRQFNFGDETHDTEELQRKIYKKYKEIEEGMVYVENGTIEEMTERIIKYLQTNKYII